LSLASEASGGLDRPLRCRIHPLVLVKRTSVETTALKSNISNSIARGTTTNTLKHSSIRIGHSTWSSNVHDPFGCRSLSEARSNVRLHGSAPAPTFVLASGVRCFLGEGTRIIVPLVDEDPVTGWKLTPNLQHIRRPQEKPRSITRSSMAMVDGGPPSSSGSPMRCSYQLNSFGGIPAGRADYHNNFNHLSSVLRGHQPMPMMSVVQAAFMTLRCRCMQGTDPPAR